MTDLRGLEFEFEGDEIVHHLGGRVMLHDF